MIGAKTCSVFASFTSSAKAVGSTPAAVSLARLLAQPVIPAPIIGANSVAQLQENLAALEVMLAPEQLPQLDEASAWQQA